MIILHTDRVKGYYFLFPVLDWILISQSNWN